MVRYFGLNYLWTSGNKFLELTNVYHQGYTETNDNRRKKEIAGGTEKNTRTGRRY